jgi:hypothetical protein
VDGVTTEQMMLFPISHQEKPRRESQAQKLDRLCDQVLNDCQLKGADPRIMLIELKFRDVSEFLSKLSEQERWNFIVRLLDLAQEWTA